MAVISPYFCQIGDESGVGGARRAAMALAGAAGFNEVDAGKVAIAVTEAATNVLKHAGGGEILLRTTEAGVEMLAIDKGPGIADLPEALRDGQSSSGTAGIGLGAISRLARIFRCLYRRGVGNRRDGAIPSRQLPAAHTAAAGTGNWGCTGAISGRRGVRRRLGMGGLFPFRRRWTGPWVSGGGSGARGGESI